MMEEYRKYEPIFGYWYLERQIGSGSFGKVFEITRKDRGTTYRSALKIISVPQNDSDIKTLMSEGKDEGSIRAYYDDILKDITHENEIMAQLKGNSNIVSYEDHQIIPHDNGIGYDILIKMELLTPLIDKLIGQKMDEKEIVRLGIDLCRALELCHRKNIIHRDIKPQNIFLSDNGDYKLGDFGISRTMERTKDGMSRKGTYEYMAPEVFRGEDYDSSVDIYSLGMVLYTLLNGNRGPFLPASPANVSAVDKEQARMRRFRGEKLPDPAGTNPMLAYIVRKACAPSPEDRYRSASQMKRDLESYYKNYCNANARNYSEYTERTAIEHNTDLPVVDGTPPVNVIPRETEGYNGKSNGGAWGKRNSRSKAVIYGIVAAVMVLIIGAAAVIGFINMRDDDDDGEGNGSTAGSSVEAADIEVVGRDINFSQVDDMETAPVDVLLMLTNNSDSPVKAVDYTISYDGDLFENRVSGGTEFSACGYIRPGETGYMYGQAFLPGNTPRKQGSIEICDAQECEDLGDYELPYGEVTAFNEEPDTYDVSVYNPNGSDVAPGSSIVIAYIANRTDLADAWGCGIVNEPVAAGEEAVLTNAIYDPGFGETIYDEHYSVLVIEKDVLGLE